MIEFEVIFFLINQVLAFYLANYYQEAIVFVFVVSLLHFLARRMRRGREML